MSKRFDIDVSVQRKAHEDALTALSKALSEVAAEAKSGARIAGRGRPVDLTPLHALMRDVQAAEEHCDITALDIQTALGEDA